MAERAVIHDASRQHRQERQQIVTAPSLELFPQGRCPIDCLDLPTVGVQVLERAGQRSGIGNERFDDGVPVSAKGAGIEHIDGVTLPAVARGRYAGVVADRAAESQDLPIARRHVPAKHAVRIEMRSQIEHKALTRVLLACCGRQFRQQRRGVRRREMQRTMHGLVLPILERATRLRVHADRAREGHHKQVTVETVAALGFRQPLLEHGRATGLRLRPDELLGGVFGGDHGTAQVPAALDVQAQFEAEPIGLAQRVLVKFGATRG